MCASHPFFRGFGVTEVLSQSGRKIEFFNLGVEKRILYPTGRRSQAKAEALGSTDYKSTVKVLRPLTLPKKASPPFDGVASLVVDRGAGAGFIA